MSYIQLVQPNLEAKDYPGYCLRLQQTVWGAPVRYATAWDAWEATQYKHGTGEALPTDVSSLIWFDHWGTYGGVYGQYGHVATFVPGVGILSNPGRGYGQYWYDTIEECSRDCRAIYVGWTEDLNSLRILEPGTNPKPKGKKKPLATVYHTKDNNGDLWAVADGSAVGTNAAWIDTRNQEEASGWARAFHLNEISITVDQPEWLRLRSIYLEK